LGIFESVVKEYLHKALFEKKSLYISTDFWILTIQVKSVTLSMLSIVRAPCYLFHAVYWWGVWCWKGSNPCVFDQEKWTATMSSASIDSFPIIRKYLHRSVS